MPAAVLPAVAAALALASAGTAASSPVDIEYRPLAPAPASQNALLAEAERFWESRLPAYRPGIDIDRLTVLVDTQEIDGPEAVIGRGGPVAQVERAGYTLPRVSWITFDAADLAPLAEAELLYPVLLHETAHALGFGALWRANGVAVPGSGAYTGAQGLAAYRGEFDPSAASVPVGRGGRAGTADGHWAEDWAGGPAELMTGALSPESHVSGTTIASFGDLGYAPAVAPVPLPAALGLALGAVSALGAARLSGSRRPPRSSA